VFVSVCVCVCVCVCTRACIRACVHACVRALEVKLIEALLLIISFDQSKDRYTGVPHLCLVKVFFKSLVKILSLEICQKVMSLGL